MTVLAEELPAVITQPNDHIWQPVADAPYRRILDASAILHRTKAFEVCGIQSRLANSKDRPRTLENPKGELSGRPFSSCPSTRKSEAPLNLGGKIRLCSHQVVMAD